VTRPDGLRRAGGRYEVARASALAALALLGPLASLSAQEPEVPVRSQRHLAVGNVTFLHTWDPAVQAGYLYQVSFRPSRVDIDEFGISTVVPPRWHAHSLLSVGWSSDADGLGRGGFAGVAQLGAMYRFDGPATISRGGLAVQGSRGPPGLGAVARLGFLHGNAALSVGWMRFDGPRSDGVVVGVDLLRCLLQDLGLVRSCVIP
jgi:hypothetical protein